MSTETSISSGPTARHDFWTLSVLSLLMAFASISTDIYLPAMPTMASSLHASAGSIELTVSGYLVGFCLGQLFWGPLSDRLGRRVPIAIGLLLFIAGSAKCAMSSKVEAMVVWRALQAVGACASVTLARAICLTTAVMQANEGVDMAGGQNEMVMVRGMSGFNLSNLNQKFFALAVLVWLLMSFTSVHAQEQQMMVRISEIQVDSKYLDEYKAILKEESEASVRLEPGVIAIFPMYERESDTEIRILEIYANREAYESHLKTPHFKKYKSTTLHMVKSLKLVDMKIIDDATMPSIFKKMKSR